MLPNYYRRVKKYRELLLTELYGLHDVQPVGGLEVDNIAWAIMACFFCFQVKNDHELGYLFTLVTWLQQLMATVNDSLFAGLLWSQGLVNKAVLLSS